MLRLKDERTIDYINALLTVESVIRRQGLEKTLEDIKEIKAVINMNKETQKMFDSISMLRWDIGMSIVKLGKEV